MIKIIKRGYLKPAYRTECRECNTLFTFNTEDTEYVNIMYTEDEFVRCPVCGNECYDKYWEKEEAE